MPAQAENHSSIPNVGGVDDDVVAERTPRVRLLPSSRKDPVEIQFAGWQLEDVDHRSRDIEMTEKDALVEDVSRVVPHADSSGGEEQRVVVVADLNGVYRHAVEKTAADLSDVELSVNLAGDPRLDVPPHLALTEVRLRQRHSEDQYQQHRPDKGECAEGHDLLSSRQARTPDLSPVRRGADSGRVGQSAG